MHYIPICTYGTVKILKQISLYKADVLINFPTTFNANLNTLYVIYQMIINQNAFEDRVTSKHEE